MNDQKIKYQAEFLSVLAQPTRLKLLYFLKDGEQCACKINPYMQEDPSVVSRHLVKMRDLGILESRKEGVSIHYRIKEPLVFQILDTVDGIVKNNLQDRVKELSQLY